MKGSLQDLPPLPLKEILTFLRTGKRTKTTSSTTTADPTHNAAESNEWEDFGWEEEESEGDGADLFSSALIAFSKESHDVCLSHGKRMVWYQSQGAQWEGWEEEEEVTAVSLSPGGHVTVGGGGGSLRLRGITGTLLGGAHGGAQNPFPVLPVLQISHSLTALSVLWSGEGGTVLGIFPDPSQLLSPTPPTVHMYSLSQERVTALHTWELPGAPGKVWALAGGRGPALGVYPPSQGGGGWGWSRWWSGGSGPHPFPALPGKSFAPPSDGLRHVTHVAGREGVALVTDGWGRVRLWAEEQFVRMWKGRRTAAAWLGPFPSQGTGVVLFSPRGRLEIWEKMGRRLGAWDLGTDTRLVASTPPGEVILLHSSGRLRQCHVTS